MTSSLSYKRNNNNNNESRLLPCSSLYHLSSSSSSSCLFLVVMLFSLICVFPYLINTVEASRLIPSSIKSFSSFINNNSPSSISPSTPATTTIPTSTTSYLQHAFLHSPPTQTTSASSFYRRPIPSTSTSPVLPSAATSSAAVNPSSAPSPAIVLTATTASPPAATTTSPTAATSPLSPLDRLQQSRDNVSQPVAQMLYEDMLMGRLMEDMCAQMYYRGKVAGFVHLYNGQEAVSTGVLKALRPDDYCVSTYRDHVHAISKGVPPREVFAELYGKQTGCSKGRGGSMHLFSKEHGMVGGFAYIGEQVPVALGFAYSSAYRRFTKAINDKTADQVTVCFTGDGSTNMGQFYEAMNLAAVAKLPILFVVENNNWAIGMAHYRSTSVPEIYKKAEGFGIPGFEVDGMDVLAVRKVAREAVDRARRGDGPTLIEALTYRFRGHSLADPDELRAPLERRAWAERDPLVTFAQYMKKMGYATDETLAITKKKARAIVDDAVRFAEASNEPVVEDIGKHIFGKHYQPSEETFTPEQLQNYATALEAELQYQERRKAGDKTPLTPVQLTREPLAVID
eukprot:GHVS01097559.1.p1 GENE.GHVS01097559.1~~GHVS01097559.1.p1  ORF type:complete len:569 (+),score=108.13 GHVS01097559.1:476-2182(+)